MDERKRIKSATNIEKAIFVALWLFKIRHKSGRKKTNVVKSLDKKL
jgi:hypothetical protein